MPGAKFDQYSFAFSDSGKWLAATDGQQLVVWDTAAAGDPVFETAMPQTAGTGARYFIPELEFKGNYLLARIPGEPHVWSALTWDEPFNLPASGSPSLTPDGRRLTEASYGYPDYVMSVDSYALDISELLAEAAKRLGDFKLSAPDCKLFFGEAGCPAIRR